MTFFSSLLIFIHTDFPVSFILSQLIAPGDARNAS